MLTKTRNQINYIIMILIRETGFAAKKLSLKKTEMGLKLVRAECMRQQGNDVAIIIGRSQGMEVVAQLEVEPVVPS